MAVLTIECSEEDICEALQDAGMECTPENVEKLKNSAVWKVIEERSVELGWELLNSSVRQMGE